LHHNPLALLELDTEASSKAHQNAIAYLPKPLTSYLDIGSTVQSMQLWQRGKGNPALLRRVYAVKINVHLGILTELSLQVFDHWKSIHEYILFSYYKGDKIYLLSYYL
jgi:hypothetical protein